MKHASVSDWLDDSLEHGSECAYIQRRGYRTERWSYRQVAEAAFQFAREIEGRGIQKADRVLIWGENSVEWVVTFFGCALRGVIAVPMDDAATANFAGRVAAEVGARLIVCSREHAQPD